MRNRKIRSTFLKRHPAPSRTNSLRNELSIMAQSTSRRYKMALVILALVTALVVANMLITFVTIHQGCSAGPKPYGWSNIQYQQYAATVCSGVL